MPPINTPPVPKRLRAVFCAGLLAASLPAHAATFTTLYAPHGHKQGAEPAYILAAGGLLFSDLEINDLGQDSGSVLATGPYGQTRTLHAFRGPDGGVPTGLAPRNDQLLIGTTLDGGLGYPNNGGLGVLFSIAPQDNRLKTLHQFSGAAGDGENPANPVVDKAAIFGTLLSDGTNFPRGAIFRYDLANGTSKVIYSFTGGADGEQPAGLVALPTLLAGIATAGGAGYGTIFSIMPDTGQETTLHAFQGGADGATPTSIIQASPTTLYGTTGATIGTTTGTLFIIDAETGALNTLHQFTADEGAQPNSLVHYQNFIYGTCKTGGAHNAGTAFGYDTKRKKFRILHQFTGHTDGSAPTSIDYLPNVALFGTTLYGGKGGGTVFRIDP